MSYEFWATLSVLVFILIHLFSQKIQFHPKFFSFAGGVAISYVFIDLIPKLCKSNDLVTQNFPFFERHVFVLALAGFLLFYCVGRDGTKASLSLLSYALFNFLVGYAIVDKNDPEVKPLLLFTIAMGLHYIVNDYTLSRDNLLYKSSGRFMLIGFLIAGWALGLVTQLPSVAIALVAAFIGGGVIMNVIRHELPKENPNNDKAFLISTFLYTLILLFIG